MIMVDPGVVKDEDRIVDFVVGAPLVNLDQTFFEPFSVYGRFKNLMKNHPISIHGRNNRDISAACSRNGDVLGFSGLGSPLSRTRQHCKPGTQSFGRVSPLIVGETTERIPFTGSRSIHRFSSQEL
ncbi:Hypothetical predicted protein [Octopus vulgaris]|uniref:Uncharacterized protein n=1 Tax=Octopus vulgaris TaxID=6645 RepID=A0AA36BKD6_OCTVU|nr:Hypothetical predicted protein [Octopus vulgaris]